MNLVNRVKEKGAAAYILLWLLAIPIPILLLIFFAWLHLASGGAQTE